MEQLRGSDAIFLYMETPSTPMHMAFVGVLDPATVPGGWSFEGVVGFLRSRLHLFPPFRRRLMRVPFHIGHPVWVEDDRFDLDYHVRRAYLPPPGDDEQLAAFAADVMSRPLDKTRPLWEIHLVEGLDGGHVALVIKLHHVIVDGVGGSDVLMALLDLEPTPREISPPASEWRAERRPSDLELVRGALGQPLRRPPRLVKALVRSGRVLGRVVRQERAKGEATGVAAFAGPRTSLNVAIAAPHRRMAFARFPLDDVKLVKRSLGGTVNDVLLAACGRALKHYLLARGDDLDRPLVASVPASARTDTDRGEAGNKLSGLFVDLATDVDDPEEQLRRISASSADAKDRFSDLGATIWSEVTEAVPPFPVARFFRLYSRARLADRHTPMYNVSISSVPGPPVPLYVAGARLAAMYPMGPVQEGAALNLTLISYVDTFYVGVIADREAVPDAWPIAEGVVTAVQELVKAAESA